MHERVFKGFEGVCICGLGCRSLGIFCTYRPKALETVLGSVGNGLGFRGQGLESRHESPKVLRKALCSACVWLRLPGPRGGFFRPAAGKPTAIAK